jgi:hypothetical protein
MSANGGPSHSADRLPPHLGHLTLNQLSEWEQPDEAPKASGPEKVVAMLLSSCCRASQRLRWRSSLTREAHLLATVCVCSRPCLGTVESRWLAWAVGQRPTFGACPEADIHDPARLAPALDLSGTERVRSRSVPGRARSGPCESARERTFVSVVRLGCTTSSYRAAHPARQMTPGAIRALQFERASAWRAQGSRLTHRQLLRKTAHSDLLTV